MNGLSLAEEKALNRLASSTSNYLRSAARQPVAWYEWGEEAFAEAKKQDKPILLDIGAVWCHWCHVIDRESYENPEIATLINALFIPIKVDVDARPDIDRRYQEVVQALTGQGGWPLTVFLTPGSQVIYGGTYFPPEDRWGMPGMKTILARVAETYRTNKDQVVAQAKRLHEEIAAFSERSLHSAPLEAKALEKIVADIEGRFDEEYGGFGEAPKFPPPTALELLLRRYATTGNKRSLSIVTKTLDAMAAGGMRDQLGGAFHRYSTDRFWRVPHFEVMLYAQAELLSIYAHGLQVTRSPRYRRVVEELLSYLTETLSDQKKGGFYGSQDADATPDDDGDYWTWTVEEAKAPLTAEEFEAASRFYGIEAQGEMRENPAKNVLYETFTQEPPILNSARDKLLAERRKRKAPFVDQVIYVNWNGLMVSGMLSASQAIGSEEALSFSLKTLDRIWKEGYLPGQGLFHVIGDTAVHTPAFLDDYASLTIAFLDAFEATQDAEHLKRAQTLADEMVQLFWDKSQGGFFDVRLGGGVPPVLEVRRKPIQDAPTPAGNSLAAGALIRLSHLTGKSPYRDLAAKTLASFAGTAQEHGLFAASAGIALKAHLEEPAHLVIVGELSDPRTKGLREAALSVYRPDRVLQVVEPAVVKKGELPEPIRELLKNLGHPPSQPTAFLCAGTQCASPATDPQVLKELVGSFGLGKQ